MKKSINFNEIMLWAIMLLPFVYLTSIWGSLPEIVPTHFNAAGEADGWGSKTFLVWLPALMIFITYGLMIVIPKIDPKRKLESMGKKYQQIKWIMVGLMSALSIFIIYSSSHGSIAMNVHLMYAMIGIFFALLGNYFPAIKHNYFVGIRTPWTLENEEVWKKNTPSGRWLVGNWRDYHCLVLPDITYSLGLPVFYNGNIDDCAGSNHLFIY